MCIFFINFWSVELWHILQAKGILDCWHKIGSTSNINHPGLHFLPIFWHDLHRSELSCFACAVLNYGGVSVGLGKVCDRHGQWSFFLNSFSKLFQSFFNCFNFFTQTINTNFLKIFSIFFCFIFPNFFTQSIREELTGTNILERS